MLSNCPLTNTIRYNAPKKPANATAAAQFAPKYRQMANNATYPNHLFHKVAKHSRQIMADDTAKAIKTEKNPPYTILKIKSHLLEYHQL